MHLRDGTPQLSSDELYSRLHAGNPGDSDFYVRTVSDAGSVLELGCGWGRITDALVAPGRRVVGIDNDRRFIERAQKRWQTGDLDASVSEQGMGPPSFVTGDMRSFVLGERFERIVIPYNAVYCLGGPDGLSQCLQRATEHLTPDGELYLDCYPIDAFHHAALDGDIPPDEDEVVAKWSLGGTPVHVVENTEITPSSQHLHVTYRVLDTHGVELARQSIDHDYLLTTDLLDALDQVGLVPLAVLGGFDGAPLDEDASQVVLAASLA